MPGRTVCTETCCSTRRPCRWCSSTTRRRRAIRGRLLYNPARDAHGSRGRMPRRDFDSAGTRVFGAIVAEAFLNRAKSRLAEIKSRVGTVGNLERIVRSFEISPQEVVQLIGTPLPEDPSPPGCGLLPSAGLYATWPYRPTCSPCAPATWAFGHRPSRRCSPASLGSCRGAKPGTREPGRGWWSSQPTVRA